MASNAQFGDTVAARTRTAEFIRSTPELLEAYLALVDSPGTWRPSPLPATRPKPPTLRRAVVWPTGWRRRST